METDVATLLKELADTHGQIEVLDRDREAIVRAARKAGASWGQIGESLGVKKQSAWERWRYIDTEGMAS